ncbi:ribonuclease J [Hasllibacter halocynthiae]|uniref:Ribonuclease J n=1 Tax=Hasllibacter halocynthiae TaxID=595589 RepID=A0A2T0X7W4_9RHOB|nr:ribonuclease J [Hasllibacter halocynthiae]PRY95042.1 ribonuclease J [Hasllibacter halocynthiae]
MTERLIYLPLGGAGEVGMNAYVYGWGEPGAERLVLVDLGVTFPDMDSTPGVDLIFPDTAWLEENRDRLEAVFVTHAHEDHVGAVGHLYSRLGDVPVYARKFTAIHARRKLEEQGFDAGRIVRVVGPMEGVPVGQMTLSFMPVPHSIPEASGMLIDTPAGRIFHTGDFKLDPDPVVGEGFVEEDWRAAAGDGVHALVCDSTNVWVPHPGRSESLVGPNIRELVAEASGMVVATTFASNVARVQSMIRAGQEAGRSVCLLGRSMQRMVAAAKEAGVVEDFPETVDLEDARDIPRESLMLVVTGSQGERRAASAQLSRGKYLGLTMAEGDTFLFSSKTIPGNERGVLQIVNAFSEQGVDVVSDEETAYHVSGHANGPDIQRVHEIMRPAMVIPMHGEHRMLRKQAEMARAAGIPSAVATNGTMLDLTGEAPKVAEHIEAGRIYKDGEVQIGALDGVVRDRIRMALNGTCVVTLIVDEDGDVLGEPWVELMGLPAEGRSGPLAETMEARLGATVDALSPKQVADDDKLDDALRKAARAVSNDEIGKKPEVIVVVSRLS